MLKLHFSCVDIELHHRYQPVAMKAQLMYNALPKPLFCHPCQKTPFCAHSGISFGGYAAGYYSYKWAEVLSADAFAAEEAGLDSELAAATGKRP